MGKYNVWDKFLARDMRMFDATQLGVGYEDAFGWGSPASGIVVYMDSSLDYVWHTYVGDIDTSIFTDEDIQSLKKLYKKRLLDEINRKGAEVYLEIPARGEQDIIHIKTKTNRYYTWVEKSEESEPYDEALEKLGLTNYRWLD